MPSHPPPDRRWLPARRLVLACLGVTLALAWAPRAAEAQLKKRVMQTALCGGMAYGGWKLGQKVAEMEIKRQGLTGSDATRMTKAMQIGGALIFCKGGTMLAGSAYDKLSKRDLEAREREMQAAVAVAEPGTRQYVMPESGRSGTMTTSAPTEDGDKECRLVVDQLADVDAGEQTVTKFCRKPGGEYELALL
ncbi:MAG: hypothetical protein IPF98_04385 [Gemmatimonadetes bacterium]|nr:hypothetical protein [Gemmatimonadota bacterium]